MAKEPSQQTSGAGRGPGQTSSGTGTADIPVWCNARSRSGSCQTTEMERLRGWELRERYAVGQAQHSETLSRGVDPEINTPGTTDFETKDLLKSR